MQRPDRKHPHVTESVDVMRPSLEVWRAIADPARVATWSPETVRVVCDDVPPLPVGATFSGTNAHGRRRWTTNSHVIESEPGRLFSFDVSYLGMDVARWRYVIDEVPGGCRVEEQWWDMRGRVMLQLSGTGTGVTDRATHNRASMRITLDAMKADLESGGHERS